MTVSLLRVWNDSTRTVYSKRLSRDSSRLGSANGATRESGRGAPLTKRHALDGCEMIVIFVKCRSAAEKRAFASPAVDCGISLTRFALESMALSAGIRLHDSLCGHCSTLLAKGNRSGFCRKCQITIGIAKLETLHHR